MARIKESELQEAFDQWVKIKGNKRKKYILRSADARLGNMVAIAEELKSGGISIRHGYFKPAEFLAFIEGAIS